MHKERIAQLIARKLSGEASPEEIKELDTLFKEYPEDAYFLSILTDYWTSPVSSIADEDADPEAHFRHILNSAASETEEPELVPEPIYNGRPLYIRNILAIAAVLAGLIFFSWLYTRSQPGAPELSRIETIAKPGAKSRLLLPDGSVVWLNSGSRISYPANFTDTLREVELEGEAYFDVAKDAKRPFVVLTRDINIKVLGTVFNVKCYPEDNKTEATLVRGLVQVSKTGGRDQEVLLLHPHEKVVINRVQESVSSNTGIAAPKTMIIKQLKESMKDTSMAEIAWVYNKLIFDGEDFREMSAEIERWYNVKIVINDSTVAGYRFHAKFENESITEVLSALRLSLPFTFKINNNEVNIYK
ncbi:FecR family protein [Chitinophaga niabensis]|uniref:Ferric-dicitrate binding protein FerR, regulates iron transport through sigma-19 n=1 Tax=Chitinophaga niabensis TaxID=536979 RepID=A0A1N6J0B7_9BACT|nr:FecR domain-containing protein [Chitinophaga niabensis]SIO37784.1 ferric-dicitrate binding protein FerR, regulates iron transport through sigma-19 [Chitinophaga niabensis]